MLEKIPLAALMAAFAGALWMSPAAAQGADAPEPMAREAFDGFRVHCLANMANPKLVRDGAREMKYAPVPAELVRQLGTDEAWYIPGERGALVLGLNARGHCGVVVQDVDVEAFARLVEARLAVAAAVDEVANGWRTRIYSIARADRTATLRLRQAADGKPRGAVSLSLSDVRAMPASPRPDPPPAAPLPAAPPPATADAPAAIPAPATIAAPAPATVPPPAGGPRVPKDTGTGIVFPGPATIGAWDPSRPVAENLLAAAFADACYQTRAQPADVLARAQQRKWKPLQASLVGGGFDFAWTTPEPPPEQVLVFYDSLKTRCCASMFGIRKLDLLTAATRRFSLAPDKAFAQAGKEVVQFKPRKDYRITVDFEPAGDGTGFANLCYLAR
jgi:hypothetical protein